jgi:hypothetical protein
MRASGSAYGQAGLLEIHGRIEQATGHEAEARDLYQQSAELIASSDPVAAKRVNARLTGPLDEGSELNAAKWQL